MQKSDKHIKAIKLRDNYKSQLITILNSQNTIKEGKRKFPVYFDNWRQRLLQLEFYIIDCKYSAKKE